MTTKLDVLKSIEIGERVAEEEADSLERYFVETDQWQQMRAGNIDVVYGPKGSGKSALYTLLNQKAGEFFDLGILLASAENVRGATVFKAIIADPPPSELAFIYLWKLYSLTLIARTLREWEVKNDEANALIQSLENAKLLPAGGTLATLFAAVRTYLTNWINRDAKSVEYALTIDPTSGAPTLSRKKEFAEKSNDQNLGDIPVDDLLASADVALAKAGLTIWVLFDRLDVAFAESLDLERNALRALFRAYSDIRAHSHICLKIFVRDDIWRRITEGGFTEASHITKAVHITWTAESLLNLVVLRLTSNDSLNAYLLIDVNSVKADLNQQRELFYRIAPDKVDTGRNPDTFDWIVIRTTDSTGNSVPREVIHLLDAAKDIQIQRLERGGDEPENEILLERAAFKDALPQVSKVRYEQTLLAEHPDLLKHLQALEGEKCEHSNETLAKIWKVNLDDAALIARRLIDVGFFEARGTKEEPAYWVPFLYRAALSLVQGKAE